MSVNPPDACARFSVRRLTFGQHAINAFGRRQQTSTRQQRKLPQPKASGVLFPGRLFPAAFAEDLAVRRRQHRDESRGRFPRPRLDLKPPIP